MYCTFYLVHKYMYWGGGGYLVPKILILYLKGGVVVGVQIQRQTTEQKRKRKSKQMPGLGNQE